jgi:hypothetical protein
MKVRKRHIFALALLLALGFLIQRFGPVPSGRQRELLALRSISDVQRHLGKPFIVDTDFPPRFGKDMVTEADFQNGIIIEVYMIRNMPPVYLVVKRNKDSDQVLQSKIDIS